MGISIYFATGRIKRELYRRAIHSFLYDTCNGWNEKFNDWTIHVISNNMIEESEHFDGDKDKGVGGVTGGNMMKLWIEDDDNDMIFMSNMMMISHELCHMIGMVNDWRERVPLRNDDWSGHRKGTELNRWTQEVHDRHVEGNIRTMSFWYRRGIVYRKMTCRVLDMKDLF